MSHKDDIKKLITIHERRLQILKEQHALSGISTDPHIILEIEKIEKEIKKLQAELRKLERVVKPAFRTTAITSRVSYDKSRRTIGDKQKAILQFIENFAEKNGFSPTFEEIQKGLKISSKSQVKHYLDVLKEAEFLTYLPKTPRSICLIDKNITPDGSFIDEVWVKVPLGTIAAGEPIQIPEPILRGESNFDDGYIFEGSYTTVSIPHNLLSKKKRIYALKVKGVSMIDASVNNGDTVVIYHLSIYDKVKNKDMVAAWLIDREETTLKYIYYEKECIRLQPANKNFNSIRYYDPDLVQIQGRVIKILRQDE
jgi:repressor LexA